MADQNITELPVKTSSGMTASDYMLGIDSAEGYQMLIKDLGDYIIRNVQVNTIAGANQTLKSALDTLNSKHAYVSSNVTLGSQVSSLSVAQGNRYGDIFIACGYIITTSAMVKNDVIATFDSLPSTFSGNYFSSVICTDGTPVNICLRSGAKVLDADAAIPAGKTFVFQLVGFLR